MNHIVVVYGPTGSGKDTFIAALHCHLGLHSNIVVKVVSSIEPIRQFFLDVQRELGLTGGMTTQEVRQGLADVKAVLDRVFGWTAHYAIRQLAAVSEYTGRDVVLIYQVRELDNIARIRELSVPLGYNFISVFVTRPGFDGRGGATTDQYDEAAIGAATVVVSNVSLHHMPRWAALVASHMGITTNDPTI